MTWWTDLCWRQSSGRGQVSIRSLLLVTEMSRAISYLMLLGKESSNMLHINTRCLVSFLTPALAGPDQGAMPGAAAVIPKGSVSVVAGGETTSRPVVEASECPGAGPFISAWWRKDNVSEHGGGQTVSQHQAEALRKRTEKEKTSTKRSSHPGRKWEDK